MPARVSDSALDLVRDYYQTNTRFFARFGQGAQTGSIHRAVWAEGVTSREQAFRYLDELVLDEIGRISPHYAAQIHVIDLGCGLGASLEYLAERAPIRGTGVTLSAEQARQAAERIARAGLGARVCCFEGNFLELPRTLEPAHLVFSIEAFVHSPDPKAYFESAAQRLVPGGSLLVCDDFLTPRAERSLTLGEQRTLDEVRRDWLAHSLLTPEHADRLASAAGYRLRSNVDLTAYLELRRPRDLLVSAAAAIGRRIGARGARWRSLVGGDALQTALGSGLIEFRCIAWSYSP
jgi:cyclopropane fatty-acyl-phospholipid synthase-like methyltransferase